MSAALLRPLLLVGVCGTLAGAQESPETPRAEFERIGRALYENENPFVGAGMRRKLEQALARDGLALQARVELGVKLGKEILKTGALEPALARLEQALALARESGARPLQALAHDALALAYLRQAEQENCLARHNADCCLFPLEGGALHAEKEPARRAREHYLALLELTPDDPDARWLLNLTAMALGEYPEGVPERWRFPPQAFASEAEFPRFRDVAPALGVDVLRMAGGVAAEDFDGDGWLDLLVSSCDPLGPLTFLRNGADGTFQDRTEEARVDDQLGGLNLVSADVDNDGDWDALVLRGAWLFEYGRIRRSLLLNDGRAVFTDGTRAAGLAEPAYPTQTAVFGDFDSDGWLELYVANESRGEVEKAATYPSQLFRRGDEPVYRDVARRAGVTNERYAKGATAGDYDNDGDLDLFVSNIGENRLYRNEGDGTFRDLAREAGVAGTPERHFACWFWDPNEDGWLDLFVAGYQARLADLTAAALGQPESSVRPLVLTNRGDGTFVDRAREVGLDRPLRPMGANFGDLDNDGWLDVYLGTGEPSLQALMPNVLLWNKNGERFLDVTRAAGMGHLQKGHGIAFADLDQDGDQDVFHQLGGFFPVDRYHSALFENPGFGNHWLTLELVGTETNRAAIGARVRVVLATPRGARTLHRAAGSVSSFGGSPHRLEIGLGDASAVTRVEIDWPRSGATQVVEAVPLDAFVVVREGAAGFERRALEPVHF